MTLLFTKDHEWLRIEGDVATVGITHHAQEQLGDIVFVELPAVDAAFEQGQDAAVVESVKAASEIYAPVSGQITQINDRLEGEPHLVNSSAEDEGWFFRMTLARPEQTQDLMDDQAYRAFIADL